MVSKKSQKKTTRKAQVAVKKRPHIRKSDRPKAVQGEIHHRTEKTAANSRAIQRTKAASKDPKTGRATGTKGRARLPAGTTLSGQPQTRGVRTRLPAIKAPHSPGRKPPSGRVGAQPGKKK